MRFFDWFTRHTEHTEAAVEANPDGWDRNVSRMPMRTGRRTDYDWEWPHVTGDDSAFWEEASGVEEKRIRADFRETLHRRDRRGQFTEKPTAPTAPTRPPQSRPSRQRGPSEIVDLTGPYLVAATRINSRQSEELAAGRDTRTLHDQIQGAPGKYTAERQRLHAQIVATFLDRPGSIPPAGQTPLLFMVGGVPGAGKTTAIRSPDGQQALGIDVDNFVILNPDDVKEEMIKRGMVPDYLGLTPNEAATLIHLESVDIVKLISTRAMSEGRNLLWDSSMRREDQAARLMGHATQTPGRAPYDVWMMLVDTPIPVAKERAVRRYLGGGRFMPLDYIDRLADPQWGSQPRRVFEQLKKAPGVKRWFRFESVGAPEIVESSES